jgi:hypothetical protein
MKKPISAILAAAVLASSFALGAIADDALDTITAQLRRNSTVSLDGAAVTMADAEGNALHPISYNGIPYLPAAALGTAFGATLSEDAATGALTYTTTVNVPIGSTMTQERMNALRGIAVFWAPTGNKIHSSPTCRSFKSGITYAGTYEQAVSVRTDGWCGICGSFTETNPHAVDYLLDDCYTFEDYTARVPAEVFEK